MLILLPPSEGKTAPGDGPALDLSTLSSPSLNRTREQVLRALVRLSATKRAAEVLGLGPTQASDLERNVRLGDEPTAPAIDVYTGVLFGEIDHASLPQAARSRADDRLAITSSVFGLVRLGDRIPAYRLSGSVTLPRLGTVASRWKPHLPKAIDALADGGLVIDLRSGTYVSFGKVAGSVSIRVLSEVGGKRSVVSHFNKATKGQIVRQLLLEDVQATSPGEFAASLKDLGWEVEQPRPDSLDVILQP